MSFQAGVLPTTLHYDDTSCPIRNNLIAMADFDSSTQVTGIPPTYYPVYGNLLFAIQQSNTSIEPTEQR